MVSLPTTSPTHLPHPSPSFSPSQQNKTLTVHHELKWYAAAGYQSKAGLMMATAAVLGVSAGNRLLSTSSSLCYSDLTSEKLFHSPLLHDQTPSPTNLITAKRSTHRPTNIKAVKHQHQHLNTSTSAATADASLRSLDPSLDDYHYDSLSLEALLVLQKSMLEKQWELSCEPKSRNKFGQVVGSGVSARERRSMKRCVDPNSDAKRNHIGLIVSQEALGSNRTKSYVKGTLSEELLTHAQVVHLSKKIKAGLLLEDYKSKLNKRLGYDPSDEQLATSLRISRAELQSKRIECSLAREKLTMSNVRLVMSVAKRYENMGVEMADLVQGGLIGLVRGIEKFDSSKGFKISTYVYWWIRQGVSRALIENSRTLRLPAHLHERLSLIRNAKIMLEGKGITPSVEKIAENLNMSPKKVKNATEAISKVFSLDREAFPSLNGLPGETLHSYIADKRLENNPWHRVDEWILKDEVNNLIKTTLREREQDIVRLYYGLDNECLTWEDISRRIGLSRERVRQVGLVALEKLKHAARRRKLDAMLVKY